MKKVIKETLADGRIQYRVKMSVRNLRTYYPNPAPYVECVFPTLDQAKIFLHGYDSEVVEQHDVYIVSDEI